MLITEINMADKLSITTTVSISNIYFNLKTTKQLLMYMFSIIIHSLDKINPINKYFTLIQ